MATGKINTNLAVKLGLCWSEEQCHEFTAKMESDGEHNGDEYTVAELLAAKHIVYDDAMWATSQEAITPPEVLRAFATQVAQEELPMVTKALGGAAAPFVAAVQALTEGQTDMREHAEAVQKCIVANLAIEGPGDMGDPTKIAAYRRLMGACKAVRAATKAGAGEAAYSAANWVYKSVTDKGKRDELGWKHRGQLAKLLKDF